MSDSISTLPRREFLLGSGALALAAGAVQAADHDHDHDHDDDHEHHSGKYSALAEESQHCVSTGNDCISHCIQDMRGGSLELTECLARVEELVATCEAMAKLATLESEHVPAMAAVTKQVCETCEKECRKFADKHAVCGDCADACVDCMKACDDVIASTA